MAPFRLHPALTPALALLAAVAALWPSAASLLSYWRDIRDYQHGFVIAAVAVAWLVLLWRRGGARAAAPSLAGSAVLAIALLAWVVAVRGDFDIVHQLLWPLLLLLTLWAVAGAALARRLAAPVGLLWFAVPVWDYGLPLLQRLSIFFSEHILALLGVPAIVTEYRVTIPAGTFEIIEGCSGKRYFIVTLAVAYLSAAINRIGGWRLVVFLVLAAGLSMLINWLRIVTVIFAGHATDMQHYFVAVEHGTLGNVMFVVLLAAVLWLGRWMAVDAAADPDHLPADQQRLTASPGAGRSALWLRWLAPLLLLGLAMYLASSTHPAGEPVRLGPLPLATARWQGPLPRQAGWSPQYVGADDERRASYRSPEGTVEVYMNLYGTQQKGRELVHYSNNVIGPGAWTRPWGDRNETLASSEPLTLLRMQGPDQRTWIVALRYQVGNRTFRSDTAAKLAYGWYSLAGWTPSGILALASACEPANCDQARARVAGFWEDMRLPLRALMPAGPGPKP